MGTNYYYKGKKKDYHIGKSSYGWAFLWHYEERLDIHGRDQWHFFLSWEESERGKPVIEDEYGRDISVREFFEITHPDYRKVFYAPDGTLRYNEDELDNEGVWCSTEEFS